MANFLKGKIVDEPVFLRASQRHFVYASQRLHYGTMPCPNKRQSIRSCIDTLRSLSIDAVEKAHSGHPGTPMGAAPTVYCLWQRFSAIDPAGSRNGRTGTVSSFQPATPRHCSTASFISNGVKAAGPRYETTDRLAVTLDDLKNFRQAGSRCTGHPEYGWTSGVETTTGPLGQGAAVSVGMAIAERWLGATYNRPDFKLFDYNVYALCSDGDIMEGISSEAASLGRPSQAVQPLLDL